MPTAKALAGAATTLIVFVVALVGLDLPEGVVAALLTVLTGALVYLVPNKQRASDERATTYVAPGGNAVRSFWPVAALPLLAADKVSENEALFWVGVLVVVGCLVAAAVIAYRTRDWVVPLVLLAIAIVAAFLLL